MTARRRCRRAGDGRRSGPRHARTRNRDAQSLGFANQVGRPMSGEHRLDLRVHRVGRRSGRDRAGTTLSHGSVEFDLVRFARPRPDTHLDDRYT